MPKISDEDYRSLELKIHTEITKVFSRFLEDLEHKTIRADETGTTRELRKPGRPHKSVPGMTTLSPAEPDKHRTSKKSIDTNKILHRTSPAGINPPINILESDMAKIFGKKQRRGTR